ncbi:MAG: sigma-70 family RNA polymerase sigma factor, partial [Mucilaginibacter polytrichastri]|nr:sigma-70 family RNA polymerase sigma factor [Mucilaginibacter polytrichastri]
RDEALEIVNDGFMKVFKKLNQYKSELAFKPWLGRIMINTAIDYHRRNLKRRNMEEIDAGKDVQDGEHILSKIGYQDLIQLVQKLSTAYRTVFNLFVIDGYSHEEIAGMLSISEGTSRSNLFKAREQLREMLKQMDREKQSII